MFFFLLVFLCGVAAQTTCFKAIDGPVSNTRQQLLLYSNTGQDAYPILEKALGGLPIENPDYGAHRIRILKASCHNLGPVFCHTSQKHLWTASSAG